MFSTLKIEIEERFTAIEQFFKATRKLEKNHAVVAKGLLFVQAYAVYEYTVDISVRTAVDSIKAHEVKIQDIIPSLMALFLDPELRSLRDATRKEEWTNRVKLFERVFSNDKLDLSSDTVPPSDGSHYRYKHLCLIFSIFGIQRMPVRRRSHGQRIDEVVNNRNAISHGRETAEEIGRQYSPLQITTTIRQMKSVCMLLVNVLDEYCVSPSKFLR